MMNQYFLICKNSSRIYSDILLINLFIFSRPTGSEMKAVSLTGDVQKPHNPDHIGGYSVSLPIFSGIESKFGICLPKFTNSHSS